MLKLANSVKDKNEQRDPTLRDGWSTGIRSISQEIENYKKLRILSKNNVKKTLTHCPVTLPQVAEVANIMQNNVEKLLER